MKIAIILGTRPEIIKMSPIIRECIDQNIDFFIIHSNQHYSQEMDKIFFDELSLPIPKYNLNVGSKPREEMISQIEDLSRSILESEKPDWIMVQGDTNTVLAGAQIASKLGIKVGHIEAGLRSYDQSMPEETNRIKTDHISNLLFTPTAIQTNILLKEGIGQEKIYEVGNTIVDAVNQSIKLIETHTEFDHLKKKKYFLLTTHRPSNVDNQKNLQNIINSLTKISEKYKHPVYFPIHPRTQKQLDLFNLKLDSKIFKILPPVGYLEMLALEKNAQLIFTDSGGIQEEACILRVPCITLRDNTERPETVDVGANIVTGLNYSNILKATQTMLATKPSWTNPFGNGDTSKKIIQITKNN
ncbi:UDP-N-acetylglucosamine 2-epimerase (non-hydrolyzing) [Patescibacteria group bacterium]|nr:UDP-N-acetylglucosamine 2-epimerase (non-hydrolyzing) [Patescibacteria group bacterium]